MNTLFDKIWDAHVVQKVDDGPTQLYIDRLYCHEVTSPQAFEGLRERGLKCFRPKQIFCMQSDAVYFGALGSPKYDNNPNAKVRPEQGLLAMRKKLGLFANIRPVTTFHQLIHKSPLRAELVDGADFMQPLPQPKS